MTQCPLITISSIWNVLFCMRYFTQSISSIDFGTYPKCNIMLFSLRKYKVVKIFKRLSLHMYLQTNSSTHWINVNLTMYLVTISRGWGCKKLHMDYIYMRCVQQGKCLRALAKLCFAGIETFGKGLSNCSDEHASGFININNFGFYMYLSKYIESDLFNYIYIHVHVHVTFELKHIVKHITNDLFLNVPNVP